MHRRKVAINASLAISIVLFVPSVGALFTAATHGGVFRCCSISCIPLQRMAVPWRLNACFIVRYMLVKIAEGALRYALPFP